MMLDDELFFEHFLARELGMTVSEMRSRCTREEFGRWRAYYARLRVEREIARAQKKG